MQPEHPSILDARAAVAAAGLEVDATLEEVNRRYRAGEKDTPGYAVADAAFRAASDALCAAWRAEHEALLRSLAGGVITSVEILEAPGRCDGVDEQEFYRVELADGRVLEFHGEGYDEWTCRMEQIS